MDDDESSEGDSRRIDLIQRQARRRIINRHVAHQSTDTTSSLPGYSSSPPGVSEMPPKYPQLTAEEADEERDEVGDVVRRVRLRRKRSSSDSHYLDSLLARSVHALELSNALLQSSMATQTSLSTLLSHDDYAIDRPLDSHARFLATQISASDSRRAWLDDITRQVDSLVGPPIGLSQSLPDAQNGFLSGQNAPETGRLQHGERPRSPPPRCMTVYADHTQPPDSILIPSTNGHRATARVHDFVPTSRNHSRQSSISADWDDNPFARQKRHPSSAGWSTPPGPRRSSSIFSHSPHPSTSTTHSIYQHGNGNASSPQLSPRRASGKRSMANLAVHRSQDVSHPHSQPQQSQYSSHSSPVRPVLSAVLPEPSTPAYNLLSAIATRTPGSGGVSESDSDARSARPDSRNVFGLGFDTGSVRGRGSSGGWVSPLALAGKGVGPRRTQSATPSTRGGAVASPLKPRGGALLPTPGLREGNLMGRPIASSPSQTGTSSPARSKPPSRTSTTSSVPNSTRHTPISSPNRNPIRHPFLQPSKFQNRDSVSDTEGDGSRLQRYKSADALRRILDNARAKAEQEAARQQEEDAAKAAQSETTDADRGKARPRAPLPTWSVIPRKGTTVAVETVAPAGTVSIQGITGGSSRSKGGSSLRLTTEPDPLVLPGEFSVPGPATAGPSMARPWPLKETLSPSLAVPSALEAVAARQRSLSAGPTMRITSLLPKIAVFGKAGIGEPPPAEGSSNENKQSTVDKGKGKAFDESNPADEIPTQTRPPKLSLQLNGTLIDPDADFSSGSESESQPSQASLPLPPRPLNDSLISIGRPSSLRLPRSSRPSSLRHLGSGASTPRSVTFSPLPPKHVPSGGRPLSEAKTRRKKTSEKEKEKPGWFTSWFGPLSSPTGSTTSVKVGYGVARRGWDSPRSMDDWQM
ncbi:hypothetical protein CTheo_3301 [Ceratobasidium theobromae]|uniref:Uncharacterized protein n=1 Tax=Ceratobasidium theobromae TaxID=1582974 RepID=A0A5N5QNJ2_9AGAM|nr:hypothetical protein CTheo_3301 [Ceratobasidium theobromae]